MENVYNFRVDPPMKYKCQGREEIIHDARVYWNFKWPEQLWTGVMFFKGERITRQEFEAQK